MSLRDLLTEIYAKGVTQPDIAAFVGADQGKISRLLNYGGDARYSVGKRIEQLYMVVCIQEKPFEKAA